LVWQGVSKVITSLKPYPVMKESGVPWVGKVPDHWSVVPNRALFAEIKDRDHPEEEMLSVTITKGVVKQKELLADSSKKDSSNLDRSAYKLVQPRDIAYNKMRAWQGAIGASDYRGIISPAYVVMRLRGDANPRYFHHLYRTPQFAKEAERWSYGITSDMWSLRPEHFRLIYSLLPPRDEQDAIVRFVEHAARRVRGYILAKQKLIKLLEEQRLAIIHRAVTRGLDPNVCLKPSSVEWLGDIPDQWEVMALRLRYSVQLGKMLDAKRNTGAHSIPYLRNTDVQWDRINTDELPTMDIKPSEYDRYTVKAGDLLVCEGGEVGRAALWAGSLRVIGYQKALHRLRPLRTNRDDARFLFFVLWDAAKKGIFHADGSANTFAHLTAEKLRRYRFAFPSNDEQLAIVRHIDETLKTVNLSGERVQREIDLLREYRVRLFASVVTGKLDVRDAAAKLPKEIEAESVEEVETLVECDEDHVALDAEATPEETEA
jgi:type I restriction enzyme, S subunit